MDNSTSLQDNQSSIPMNDVTLEAIDPSMAVAEEGAPEAGEVSAEEAEERSGEMEAVEREPQEPEVNEEVTGSGKEPEDEPDGIEEHSPEPTAQEPSASAGPEPEAAQGSPDESLVPAEDADPGHPEEDSAQSAAQKDDGDLASASVGAADASPPLETDTPMEADPELPSAGTDAGAHPAPESEPYLDENGTYHVPMEDGEIIRVQASYVEELTPVLTILTPPAALPDEDEVSALPTSEDSPDTAAAHAADEVSPEPTPFEPPPSPDHEMLDYKSVEAGLKHACVRGWSGILRVHDQEQQVGAIIMRSGEVAWAVYNRQSETLGTFLLGEGEISKEQLNMLQEQYIALKKTKKLGTLLEESGIITRTRLKHFLRIHIRRALVLMMEKDDYYCISSGGSMQVDEDLTFSWKDLFLREVEESSMIPRLLNSNLAIQVVSSANPADGNHFLRKFATLAGYRFSFLARTDGKIITMHKKPDVTDSVMSFKWMADMIAGFADAGMGHVSEADITTDNSVLLLRFLTEYKEFILCVSLDDTGRLGVAKHLIGKELKIIENFINSIR